MASNQRYGCYVTTGRLTQEKINSFRGFLRGERKRNGNVDLNTADGVYDYSFLDNDVDLCKENKLSMIFQLWRNPLKQNPFYWRNPPYSVPVVNTDDSRVDLQQYYFYMDTDYIMLCDQATNALAAHLKTYTTEQKQVILGWLGSFGVTGDRGDYKGTPDESKYLIPVDTFENYWHESTLKLIAANAQNPWLNIGGNPNNNAIDWDYLLNLGILLLKLGELGHGYGASGEGTIFRRTLGLMAIYPNAVLFSESEGAQEAPEWRGQDFLPLVVSFVTAGGKILSVAATDNTVDVSLAFLNLYAGSDEGGFSYMRDALDFADKNRFTEAIYGPVIDPTRINSYNQQVNRVNNDPVTGVAAKAEKLSALLANYINPFRVSKIKAEYALRGYLFNSASYHENDGNVDLWPGNYEMRLHLKVFEGYGYNRLGDNREAFGRYMRCVKYAAWYYDYPTLTQIKITYFDNKSAFNVRALHENGAQLVATISCQRTLKWVQQTFTIAGFVKGGINGNDVVINSIRGTMVLQIIEVK